MKTTHIHSLLKGTGLAGLAKGALAVVIALTATACSHRTHEAVTVTPAAPTFLTTADSTARIDLTMQVPRHYISKRSRLIILPQLLVDNHVEAEYEPVVLDAPVYAKKNHRMEKLSRHYTDPYAIQAQTRRDYRDTMLIPYNKEVAVPADFIAGRIVGVVTTDGCGECSSIDTINMGDVVNYRALLPTRPTVLQPVHSEFVIAPKVRKGQGEARLQFIVDKWDIVMDLANNRNELTAMLDSLRPIVTDTLCTLNALNIFGSASAEASYQHNVMLANNRANSAKQWLVTQLNMPAAMQQLIRTGAAPEGWEPVVQAMRAAGDPDSIKVRELMIKYPGPTDDAAEKYIRRLPCWKRIRDNYLAKDRKVLYNYAWEMRNYTTDEDLMRMWSVRPETFNEVELLKLATLVTPAEQEKVYSYTLKQFPQSAEALTNLALIYLERGDDKAAEQLLVKIDSPESRYEQGIICARRGDLARAAQLLPAEGDANAAIVALAQGDKQHALHIMATCKDQSERANRVRRILKMN